MLAVSMVSRETMITSSLYVDRGEIESRERARDFKHLVGQPIAEESVGNVSVVFQHPTGEPVQPLSVHLLEERRVVEHHLQLHLPVAHGERVRDLGVAVAEGSRGELVQHRRVQ